MYPQVPYETETEQTFTSPSICKYEGNPESDILDRLAPSSDSQIQVIEWHMMDMWKFYPLSMLSSFSIRCVLYPFTLVKTKMQVKT